MENLEVTWMWEKIQWREGSPLCPKDIQLPAES